MVASKALFLSLLLSGASSYAVAHTHLQKSDPADGSTLQAPPTEFVLSFSEAARLTVLSLQKAAGPAQKLTPLPTAAARQITIPAPHLAPGTYTLSWRVLSDDGHVMPGKLTFTIANGVGGTPHTS